MPAGMEFGIIGLGQIGGGLAEQALKAGMRVVGFDTQGASDSLLQSGVAEIGDVAEYREELQRPRIIFLYIPAGPVIDDVLDDLMEHLDTDDIVVDGGNSYWRDSMKRHERLADAGVHFVDLGTSGGLAGAREGACFMAGGDHEPVQQIEPILRALSVEGGYVYTGQSGSGHFVKLVHNGIEFGMLQAIGEGISLLKSYDEPLDLGEILGCWSNGSVIRSWLIDLMRDQYRKQGEDLDEVPPYVEDTGEVNWLVSDAMAKEVEIPVIAASVMQLFASRDDRQDWARAIAMMRHGFGGHPFGKDQSIAEERQEGRVASTVEET